MTAPPPEEPVRQVSPQPSAPAPAPTAGPPAPASAATTPPNFTAAYLNNPGPQYPYASRRQREQGVVRLKVLVSADGLAEQVLVDRTSGFANLDAAAVEVVKKRWRFVPAKQGDRAVSAWVAIPMQFELKDR
jgi:protein TonB